MDVHWFPETINRFRVCLMKFTSNECRVIGNVEILQKLMKKNKFPRKYQYPPNPTHLPASTPSSTAPWPQNSVVRRGPTWSDAWSDGVRRGPTCGPTWSGMWSDVVRRGLTCGPTYPPTPPQPPLCHPMRPPSTPLVNPSPTLFPYFHVINHDH